MQHMLVPDQSGKGRWMLILDCPWDQQYKLYDRNSGTTGLRLPFALPANISRALISSYLLRMRTGSCNPFLNAWYAGFHSGRIQCLVSSKLQVGKRRYARIVFT